MIRSNSAHLKTVAQSHPGMTGKNNEDRYAVSAYRLSGDDATPAVFAVLCDGIGGHRAGEVAAEVAVNTISQVVAASDARRPMDILQEAIDQASDRIYTLAQADSNQHGMGATCACAWVIGDHLYTATVGDSRIYLIHLGAIQQLTTDHTWVQEALEKGILKREELRTHPNAHIIRRFLGSPNAPTADFRLRLQAEEDDDQAVKNQGVALVSGDLLLLCSDGLTDLVDDDEILEALQAHKGDEAVNRLVDQANGRGGHDNITIITLEVPTKPAAPVAIAIKQKKAKGWPVMAIGCGSLVLIALVIGFALIRLGLVDFHMGGGPTASPTLTLPSVLQTVLPAGSAGTAAPVPVIVTPLVTGLPPGASPVPPTATPWATNTPSSQLPGAYPAPTIAP